MNLCQGFHTQNRSWMNLCQGFQTQNRSWMNLWQGFHTQNRSWMNLCQGFHTQNGSWMNLWHIVSLLASIYFFFICKEYLPFKQNWQTGIMIIRYFLGNGVLYSRLGSFSIPTWFLLSSWPPCCLNSVCFEVYSSWLRNRGFARYLTNKTRKLLNKRSGTQTMNADLQVPSCVQTIQSYVCFNFGGKVYHFAMYSSWVCNRLWFWLITTKSRRTRCRILYIM